MSGRANHMNNDPVLKMVALKEEINIKMELDLNFKMLTAFGLWIPTHIRGTMMEVAYQVYTALMMGFLLCIPLLSELAFVVTVFGDMQQVVEGSFLMMTHVVLIVKCTTIIRGHTRIEKLLENLDDPMFNLVDVRSHNCLLSVMRKHYIFKVIYTACGWFCIIMFAIFPLLVITNNRKLPLEAWFPFDVEVSPRFELLYVYQIGGTLIMSTCNASQDTLTSGLMAIACGQLDLLCDKLSDKHHQHPVRSDKEAHDHLVDCAKHHQKIIQFVQESQILFNASALTQLFSSCIIICVTAFKLSLIGISLEFFAILLYLTCMLMQVLNYCYFGNEVFTTSVRITDAAYASMWYEQSIPNRRLLIILMERAKRPLEVTAGIFALSLATFTSILRSSYSFYAVLEQVNN